MKKSVSFLSSVLVLLSCHRGWACWTNEELSALDPKVQIKTYFWMPQLKRGVRIAQTTYRGKSYFIMIGCEGNRSPSVETMDDWSSAECKPLGHVWLPIMEPNEQRSGEIPYYIEKIQEFLEESRNKMTEKSLSDKAISMAEHFLSLTLGTALFSVPFFYNKDIKNETNDHRESEAKDEGAKEKSRKRQNWRKMAKKGLIPIKINLKMSHIFKAVGGLWIAKTLYDAYEEYTSWSDEKSREDKSLRELEELLLAIEGGRILHLDGEEADRRIDQIFTFESLVSAFKYASDQTYQKICQKEEN